ncbi:YcaO-like family protein [Lentilactobacillus kefiri]|uniref:YcaO-like family protein n=1 Tax=Lentilactobacillus kefiri TaxID=33962 RepID=UPI00345ED90B
MSKIIDLGQLLNVYVVHCTTEDEEKHFPIYTHGAGASLNILVAISRAITECVQLRTSQLKIEKHKELFTKDLEYWSPVNKIDNLNRNFFVLCHD